MLWFVSHSYTLVLVSSTGVFLWTSLFRWESEQGLCVFQSPRIPFWTLSGFRLCAALPVSIKRSVGARVWHHHRTWWKTVEYLSPKLFPLFNIYFRASYFLSHIIFVLCISQCLKLTFVAETRLSMKKLAHSLKPQSNEFYVHVLSC